MKIIAGKVSLDELKKMAAAGFGDMVKAVVDVERQVIAIDAEMHADLEALLLDHGSRQRDLWGINLYPETSGSDFIQYDSMINMRPSQGNRSRGVEDPKIRSVIEKIVSEKVAK